MIRSSIVFDASVYFAVYPVVYATAYAVYAV